MCAFDEIYFLSDAQINITSAMPVFFAIGMEILQG